MSENAHEHPDLGPLPEDWRVVRLEEVVSYQKGRKPRNLVEASRGDLPYLTAEYFRTGKANQFVPAEGLSKNVVCEQSDIVLIWDGSNAGDVFTGLRGVLASTMVKIAPTTQQLDRALLYFFLKTQFGPLNSTTMAHYSCSLEELCR